MSTPSPRRRSYSFASPRTRVESGLRPSAVVYDGLVPRRRLLAASPTLPVRHAVSPFVPLAHVPVDYVPEEVAAAFAFYDPAGSGVLDRRQLRDALRGFGVDASAAATLGLLRHYCAPPHDLLNIHQFADLIYDVTRGAPWAPDGHGRQQHPPGALLHYRRGWAPAEPRALASRPLAPYTGAVPPHNYTLRDGAADQGGELAHDGRFVYVRGPPLAYVPRAHPPAHYLPPRAIARLAYGRPPAPSLREVFEDHDYEARGVLDARGLRHAVSHLGGALSPAEAAELVGAYGVAARGDAFATCKYAEFAAIVHDLRMRGVLGPPTAAEAAEEPYLAARHTQAWAAPIGGVAAPGPLWYGHAPLYA
jgi:Ca2+-binding EF-hand superfamily protein